MSVTQMNHCACIPLVGPRKWWRWWWNCREILREVYFWRRGRWEARHIAGHRELVELIGRWQCIRRRSGLRRR